MKRYKRDIFVDGHPIMDLVQDIVLRKDDITNRFNDQCDEISTLLACNERLVKENALLTSKISGYQKFMASYICYTPDELAEEERRRILKVAYELKSAFPHHTGVYHWMIGYADELLQNKQKGGE